MKSTNIKYQLQDTDEGLISDLWSEDEILSYLREWNEMMDTDYQSIEEFNEGEDYYSFVPIQIETTRLRGIRF